MSWKVLIISVLSLAHILLIVCFTYVLVVFVSVSFLFFMFLTLCFPGGGCGGGWFGVLLVLSLLGMVVPTCVECGGCVSGCGVDMGDGEGDSDVVGACDDDVGD